MAPVNIVVSAAAVPAASILVHSLLTQAEEAVRRETLGEFFKANHSKAMVFACAALKDRGEAQDAVAATFVELLEGRTAPEFFFRALKANILDRQRKAARARALFESADCSAADDEGPLERPSSRREDRDPLDILVDEEEVGEALGVARSERRFRWIWRTDWSESLPARTGLAQK